MSSLPRPCIPCRGFGLNVKFFPPRWRNAVESFPPRQECLLQAAYQGGQIRKCLRTRPSRLSTAYTVPLEVAQNVTLAMPGVTAVILRPVDESSFGPMVYLKEKRVWRRTRLIN